MQADRPLCFVLMPFGAKKDPSGGPDINFNAIYEQAIRPGIESSGLEPIRADEELTGGIIHKPMFERLLLCDFAVADLTTANGNVLYELGVRHAVRPATTLTIFAKQQSLPFDVNFLRALPYDLGEGNRFGSREASTLSIALTKRLEQLRSLSRETQAVDSPVFQLLQGYHAPDIDRLRTDIFREQAHYSAELRTSLAEARRRRDLEALVAVEQRLGSLDGTEVGVLVDLFLSYRALEAWDAMVELFGRMPAALRQSVIVREQLGFALNRQGKRQEALDILEKLVQERGPSSETCGLIGRVYKDLWVEAKKTGSAARANGFLGKAIDSYVRGFEADWRDAYPGINAVTLLDLRGDMASLKRKAEILPVVRFACLQRLRTTRPDYWDHATLLELAILDSDPEAAQQHLGDALASVREPWEPKTTANNLRLIRAARQDRDVQEPWLDEILAGLEELTPA
jgi:tetratricopeptide (TPR) repeat protein